MKERKNSMNSNSEDAKAIEKILEKDYRIKENSISSIIKIKTRTFRDVLLEQDFLEATKYVESRLWKWKYYKQTSEDVAFIVNLEAYTDYIEIYYGYASTAFTKMTGCENTLKEWGVDSENINVRNMIRYKMNDNEELIQNKIKEFYLKYFNLSKNEILAVRKEKQKRFINRINDKLKPLGFKKKNTTWTKNLVNDLYLEFYAEKSWYSDEYYFNISLYNNILKYSGCFDTRFNINDKGIFDWQILSDEELNEILDSIINNYLLLIIHTPLNQLCKVNNKYFKLNCKKKACNDCYFK